MMKQLRFNMQQLKSITLVALVIISSILMSRGNSALAQQPDYFRVYDFKWHPDGTYFALATDTGIWFYTRSGDDAGFINRSGFAIDWSPTGDEIGVVSGEFGVITYPDLQILYSVPRASADYNIDWNPTQEIMAIGLSPGVGLYDTNTGDLISEILDQIYVTETMTWNGQGDLLAVAGVPRQVYIWNSATQSVTGILADDIVATALAWSPDDTQLAVGLGNDIYIWDVVENTLVTVLEGHADLVIGLSWSTSGLASLSWDNTIKIWNVGDGTYFESITTSGFVQSLAWSPDGKILLYVDDTEIVLLDGTTVSPCEPEFIIANGDTTALITAITTANSTPEPDTICLAEGGTYTFTSAYASSTALPAITSDITIEGNGASMTRSGTNLFRFFKVNSTGREYLHG
jgi:Anaphase-promoting complex subunit 4 WD40 domain